MSKKILLKVTLALLVMFTIVGCGDGGNSNTNGDLTLVNVQTVAGPILFNFTSTASVTPASFYDVVFTAKQYKIDGTLITSIYTETEPTNGSGVAIAYFNFTADSIDDTWVEITAKVKDSGLFRSETIYIPKQPAP